MPSLIQRVVPSMFRRRLLLLAAVVAVTFVLLAAQMTRLTVVQGDDWRKQAEKVLVQHLLIATPRGRILDCRGRVLAEDAPTFDVAVRFDLIDGQWATERARKLAKKELGPQWGEISATEQDLEIGARRLAFDAQIEQVWATLCKASGIERAALDHRVAEIRSRVTEVVSDVELVRYERLAAANNDEPVDLAQLKQPIGEQRALHTIVPDIDDVGKLAIESLLAAAAGEKSDSTSNLAVWRRVAIVPARHRVYPLQDIEVQLDRSTLPGPLRHAEPLDVMVPGVAMHMIGALRPVQAEDFGSGRCQHYRHKDERGQDVVDLAGYLDGDLVGKGGIERSFEAALRGRRGQDVSYLDTGTHEQQNPEAGKDVHLTVDVKLQADVQAIMGRELGLMSAQLWHHKQGDTHYDTVPLVGQPLNGAALVLDIATSQVLTAVSVPAFGGEIEQPDDPKSLEGQTNHPWTFRPVSQSYEPGSTVKPLVLAAATTDGTYQVGQTIDCKGYLNEHDRNSFRCWIYKQQGIGHNDLLGHALSGPEAIGQSCNIFFYTMGRRMGGKRLVSWYDQFGLGRVTSCGIDGEVGGMLPDLANVDKPKSGFDPDDATNMGIGQGPMQWTPLQAAAAYAALVRGGQWVAPTFVARVADQPQPQSTRDLHLDPRGVAMALDGMERVVREGGTGYHIVGLGGERIFTFQGARIIGKSGTADTGKGLRVNADDDPRITSNDPIVRSGDHAWFIALVQKPGSPKPDYVVAVVVEYGGSGAAVSGPIVNQILYALKAEGYL